MRALSGILPGLLVAGTLTACGSSAGPRPTTVTATIRNYAFSPRVLRIYTGDTVAWKNTDTADHTVTDNRSGAGSFASSSLSKGATFSAKFTVVGTFHYHCAFHPFMTGVVIVRPPHA